MMVRVGREIMAPLAGKEKVAI